MLYAEPKDIHTPRHQEILDDFIRKIAVLESAYDIAIKHINDVPSAALNQLPTKLEAHNKLIKESQKNPANLEKIKEFEWDRIEALKLAILHY